MRSPMRAVLSALTLLFVFPAVAGPRVADPAGEPTAEDWIRQLEDPSLQSRQEAFFQLQLLGGDARKALAAALGAAGMQTAHAIRYLLDHEPIAQRMDAVPSAVYPMGSRDPEYDNPHRVVHLDAFLIDRYEVTQFMYYVFVRSTGHAPPPHWEDGRYPLGQEDVPATGISAEDAQAYAAWAGKRLPTENEWEAAARGRDGGLFPWGDQLRRGLANIDGLALQEVGSYTTDVSHCGCFDLAGNASEWVLAGGMGGASRSAAHKGAAFDMPLQTPVAACAFRSRPVDSGAELEGVGFRCVRDAPASPAER